MQTFEIGWGGVSNQRRGLSPRHARHSHGRQMTSPRWTGRRGVDALVGESLEAAATAWLSELAERLSLDLTDALAGHA
jgi:hypothetical protein